SFNIIQDAEIPYAQLELGERVGAEPLDCLRRSRRLVQQAGFDGLFKDALLADGGRPQLSVGVVGGRGLKCPRPLPCLPRRGGRLQLPAKRYPCYPQHTSPGSNEFARSGCRGSTRTAKPCWPLERHGIVPRKVQALPSRVPLVLISTVCGCGISPRLSTRPWKSCTWMSSGDRLPS